MISYNITFVLDPKQRGRFIEWARNEAMPLLFGFGSAARDPKLQEVIEAGGEKPGPDHGASLAISARFDNEEAARKWHDEVLPPVLAMFNSQFGPQALFFITMLQNHL